MTLKNKSKMFKRVAWIIGILLIWQIAPLVVGIVAMTASRDPGPPKLSESEQSRLQALMNPAETDLNSATAFIESLRSAHLAAIPIWQQATRRLLANMPQKWAFADLDSKFPQAPENVAKRYASHANWLKSDFWKDNREKMLITALGYGNTDEDVISELQSKLSSKTETSPESERIYFLTMAFLNQRRYQDALNTVVNYNKTRSYER